MLNPMLNLRAILSRSLLALALATGAGAAFAVPTTYHVQIDTSALGTGPALLDLSLGSVEGAAPVTATLDNFKGVFGEYSDRLGDSSGSVAGTVVLGNSEGWNDLLQAILLGGLFSFDVSFETSGEGPGSTFGAILFKEDMSGYLGLDGNLVQIDLMPGAADVVSPGNAFATVTTGSSADVPEPADWMLVATGLLLMGMMQRRRSR
jgi:hypothetical protein